MKINKAVIPAAGRGTRLGPVTNSIPKEMLPIGSQGNFKPFIHYVIEEAINSGVSDTLIITRPGKNSIQHYFDTVGIDNIHYRNQREQLGLGHAVLQAEAFVNGKPFAVLLGDDYYDCKIPATKQMIDICSELPNNATIIAVEKLSKEAITQKGMVIVETSNKGLMKVKDLVEKPSANEVVSNLAISGRYILPPQIFPILKNLKPSKGGEIQLTDAIHQLLKQYDNVFAIEIKGARSDIGTPLTYADALLQKLLSNPNSREGVSILLKHYNSKFDKSINIKK